MRNKSWRDHLYDQKEAKLFFENTLKQNISSHISEEGVVDIIIQLYNVKEEYDYLTRNSR